MKTIGTELSEHLKSIIHCLDCMMSLVSKAGIAADAGQLVIPSLCHAQSLTLKTGFLATRLVLYVDRSNQNNLYDT